MEVSRQLDDRPLLVVRHGASTFLWWVVPCIASLVALFRYFSADAALRGSYDDAFITYRYARNLASGHGLVYNAGQMVDSASSFLWMLVLAIAYRLGFHDLPAVAALLGVACVLGVIPVVMALGDSLGSSRAATMIALLIACVSGPWLYWSASGMEVGIFALLCYATILSSVYEVQRGSMPYLSSGLAVLAFLSRYEGMILFGALLAARVLVFRRQERQWHILAMQAGLFAAVTVAFIGAKWLYYGSPIPHAVAFKSVEPYYQQARHPLTFLVKTYPALMLGALFCVATLRRRPQHETFGLIVLAVWLITSIIAVKVGPYADLNRYAVHLIPGVALLCAIGVSGVWRQKAWAVLALSVVVLTGQLAASAYALSSAHQFARDTARAQVQRETMGDWLGRHTPPHTLVLSGDAGAIGWYSDRPILDGAGLVSADAQTAKLHGTGVTLLTHRRPAYVADTELFTGSRWLTRSELELKVPLRTVPGVRLSTVWSTARVGGLRFTIERVQWNRQIRGS